MQEDEIKDVQKALEEDLVYLEQLQALHEENARQQGPSLAGGNRSRLDSSMKKCAAVTRKLKTLSEASAQGILDDLSKVNMSKYASEAVSSVVEAPLKLKDVRAAVQVLSALNAYPDFRTLLFGRLMEELTGSAVGAAGHVQKRRVLLRLFFGCVQAGIFPASDVRYITLDKIFRSVSSVSGTTIAGAAARTGRTAGLTLDTPSGLEASLQSLALVNAFLKAGGPGLYPRVCGYKNEMRLRELAKGSATTPPDATAEACVEEIEKINGMKLALWALPEGDEQKLRMKVQAYVEGAVKALDAWYKQVVQTKKRNDVAIQSRGDISEKRHQEYKDMREALDAFQKAVGTLAGTLRVRLPEYVVEEDVEAEEKGGSVHLVEPTRIFEDAEERALYMALPQLAEVVPSTLLGVAGGDDADGEASDGGGDVDMDMIAEATDMDMEMDLKASEHADQADQELEGGRLGEPGPEEDQPASTSSLSELIGRLSECVTMEECDAFSVQYCYVGGKKASSQRALALALSRPPHGAIQLLPFFSRVIASLAPFFPIIKEEILSKLQRQFHGLKNVLDISMDTLEPRLRNASYIAELVKFGVYPPGKAFMQLRSLFDDFSRQNIDTACCLVQNCGALLLLVGVTWVGGVVPLLSLPSYLPCLPLFASLSCLRSRSCPRPRSRPRSALTLVARKLPVPPSGHQRTHGQHDEHHDQAQGREEPRQPARRAHCAGQSHNVRHRDQGAAQGSEPRARVCPIPGLLAAGRRHRHGGDRQPPPNRLEARLGVRTEEDPRCREEGQGESAGAPCATRARAAALRQAVWHRRRG